METEVLLQIIRDCHYAQSQTLDGPDCTQCPLYDRKVTFTQDCKDEEGPINEIKIEVDACLMLAEILSLSVPEQCTLQIIRTGNGE